MELVEPVPVHPSMPVLRFLCDVSPQHPVPCFRHVQFRPAERAEWDTSSAAPCLSVTGMRGQQCYVVVTLKNVATVNPVGWCAAFWYVPIADVVA